MNFHEVSYKMKHRKVVIILLFIALGTLLSGCWSYSEIDERFIVGAVGIDYAKKQDMYRITIRAVNAKPSSGGIELVPVVISTEGSSVFEGIRKAAPLYSKKTYWSHLQSIILSDEVAEQDVLKTLDFFYRDAEVRQDNMLYVSSGCSAEEVVRLEADLMKKRQFSLRHAVRTHKFESSFPETELIDFQSKILNKTIDPIVPLITIDKKNGEEILRLEGSAVFVKSKMVGKLNRYETLMARMLINDVKNPVIIIPVNDKKNLGVSKAATIEVLKSKTKLHSSTKDGNIDISLAVNLDAGIGELNYPINFLDENSIKDFENIAEADIKEQIIKTINKVQQDYKADIFGFGKKVEINNPELWNTIKSDWKDKFSNVSVDTKVTVSIRETGKMSEKN